MRLVKFESLTKEEQDRRTTIAERLDNVLNDNEFIRIDEFNTMRIDWIDPNTVQVTNTITGLNTRTSPTNIFYSMMLVK